MTVRAGGTVLNAKKLTALVVGLAAVATALMSLGAATANADVKEIAPRPNVTSRQATIIDQNALRRTAQGEARGQFDNRSAGNGGVSAQGEVRDSVIAVPGTSSRPFLLPQNGQFRSGAPMGSW